MFQKNVPSQSLLQKTEGAQSSKTLADVIVWGNSSDSKKVFTLQKKIVGIMVGTKPQNSFRDYRSYLFHVNINFHC
jgi:hypothetical protein